MKIVLTAKTKLFARDLISGEIHEITDLYWFEKMGVRCFDQDGYWNDGYEFWLEIEDDSNDQNQNLAT